MRFCLPVQPMPPVAIVKRVTASLKADQASGPRTCLFQICFRQREFFRRALGRAASESTTLALV